MKKVVTINEVKKGGYIIHDDEAYKVGSIQHSKAGKHGHGKYRIEAISVTSGKKTSIVMGSGHKIDVPIIEKHNAQILTIEDRIEQRGSETINKKVANVMDVDSYETFDMDIPEELESELKEGDKVMYWGVLGNKMMKQIVK